MRDDHHRRSALEHTSERALQVRGVELREAFIQHDEIGLLQQRPRDEQTAALAMRQLPAVSPTCSNAARNFSAAASQCR